MKTIIQQIAKELVDAVTKKVMSDEIRDIDALASDVEKDCKKAAKMIIESAVYEMNLEIRADKESRKRHGLVLKEKERSRRLYTRLGQLDLKRDYYYDKTNICHAYPLDKIVGIRRYERIGDTVSADMVNLAADVSYAKSTRIATGGEISRQSVHDHILKLEVPETCMSEERRTVKHLHIYADEDHVHMQKPGKERGKRNQIVPLVTVTEGTDHVSKRRNKTVSPVHFADEGFDTKRLWKEVEGYIEKSYDMDELEKIYVHGDGGSWIKNGLDSFAQTEHVMDGYHFGKHLKKIARAFPRRNVRNAIEHAIKKGSRKKAGRYILSLMDRKDKENVKKISDFAKYLYGNWESIGNLEKLNIPGSCTEGQISHILSERFSRDPLGWSRQCLGKLSKVRVYRANGNEIDAKDFKEHEQNERYYEYADRFIRENIDGCFDWSIFEGKPHVFDKASGTQLLIDSYGTDHGVLMS